MRTLLRGGAIVALAVALLAWPVAWGLGASAETYQQVAPFDDALIGVNRLDYADEPTGEPADVIAIYGTIVGEPTAYLFVDEDEVIRPVENPELVLLRRPEAGQPLQLKLVHSVTRMVSIGALAGGLVLLGVAWAVGRRRDGQGAAAAA